MSDGLCVCVLSTPVSHAEMAEPMRDAVPQPKQHLDQFNRFSTAHTRDQQTDAVAAFVAFAIAACVATCHIICYT